MKRIFFFSFLLLSVFLLACGHNSPHDAFSAGDYKTAFKLWQSLAAGGDAEAQNFLGIHYSLGLGVKKDVQKAASYYRQAAQLGHADAQRNLADSYNNGHGVSKDNLEAFKWYFAASQQGNENAKKYADFIAQMGNLTPNQQMYAKIEASRYILDVEKRFNTRPEYIDTNPFKE